MTHDNLVGLVYVVHYCKDGRCKLRVLSNGSGENDAETKAKKWQKRWGVDFTEILTGGVWE